MSGEGRRTIHRETGSGGWPNGLTVDYMERRIVWIDARYQPHPRMVGELAGKMLTNGNVPIVFGENQSSVLFKLPFLEFLFPVQLERR